MAWQDRLLPATYISPSGIPFLFQYENVSLSSDKKTSEFIFPEIDGAFIQDLGRAGRKFPLTLFFSGDNYDILSDAFLSAVEEKGIGTLIHPLYGVRSVVTTGTITRRDDLLTAANQAAFSITFSETLTGLTFPASLENVLTVIKTAIAIFETASSAKFATDILINTASESIALQQAFEAQRFIIDETFSTIIKANEDLNSAFQTINNSLKSTISDIVEFPDTISSQLITFIRTPSQLDSDIFEKIDIYENVINVELNKTYTNELSTTEPQNTFFSNTLQAFSCLTASCESVLTTEFQTKKQAVEISERILTIFDNIKIWQDNNIDSLEIVDTGASYESLLQVVSLTTAYLIELSFELPNEKILILGEDRNIIELVSELYGDLDKIDFFIQTNNLTADEIEILKQGKEIVYYA